MRKVLGPPLTMEEIYLCDKRRFVKQVEKKSVKVIHKSNVLLLLSPMRPYYFF